MSFNEELTCWEIFIWLYQLGSIQEVANKLDLDSSTVSKKIAFLEKKMGHQLFDRRTRPFVPTSDAHLIIKDAENIVFSRNHINRFFNEKQNEDNAVIRIMLGNSYRRYAPKLIAEYCAQNPKLRFNIISPIDINDYLNRRADLISVSGQVNLPDSMLLPRGNMIFVPVATPEYIKKFGQINHPRELEHHRTFNNLYADRFSFKVNFPFKKENQLWCPSALDTIRWSSVEMALQATLEGFGVSPCLPLFLCIDDLEKGNLVPILDGWHRPSQMNYVAIRQEDWKLRYLRNFATWWADKQSKIEDDCEKRLIKLYGEQFLNNLKN